MQQSGVGLGAGINVSTNVTAYQMPYIHGLHCGYIISSSGGLNVAIFQLMEKLWWLKSGLFLLKVGGIPIFQSGNTAGMYCPRQRHEGR